ncbi:VOC family protein [Aestuariimicrobium soli]|uniref:VOC family protein n=1 Tax=Aestuariimicrobium soli TaxID=2035834 RepID=UPI003EBE86B9
MHVDHLIFACGPEGLQARVEQLSDLLGEKFKDGGFHPRFGTRNNILPLTGGRYLEVVEVLDHPAAEKAVFGQAVRARSEMGGGWLGWVISVDDLAPYEQRLDRKAVPGSRHFPDGRLLEWQQIGIKGLMADPQLPYFLKWESGEDVRPSALQGDITLLGLDLAGSKDRVDEWVGEEIGDDLDGVALTFLSENGQPGIQAVNFEVPGKGTVRI